ncbi:MAG: flagellar biosynthetic protein FliR [Polyangiaceae bacterium]
MPSVLSTTIAALSAAGVDLAGLGLAWARVLPTVTLVPAFGLRALPAPARAVMGLAFAATVFPAMTPAAHERSGPWIALAAVEFARGLPVALAAAVPLWAATMAGGVADALRGAPQETQGLPTMEGRATTLGVTLSLLACALFLEGGGPARVVHALAVDPPTSHPVLTVAGHLVSGITLAVALGAPLLAASIVVEVAAALVARAASPAQVHALLSPLRAVATLAIFGVVLERVAATLARALR